MTLPAEVVAVGKPPARCRGRPAVRIVLRPQDRRVLERRSNAPTSPQRDALRARIVLAAADGQATGSIARRLGIAVDTVSQWRGRFSRSGIEGLKDLPRSGRPPAYTPIQRCEMMAVACEPAPSRDGTSGWTLEALRDQIHRRGIARISRSHLHTILQRADLQPHKKRMWLHSPDPRFREKVAEIVELYLHPRAGSTVVCVDEKTGMQAVQRLHPDRPALPGRKGRREFEYLRHGSQSLFAAFIVHTGTVITRCRDRRKAADLEGFMEVVAGELSGRVEVIWDNLNIHQGGRWEKFNARHQNRFRFHYTPLHASWVNQVELWFGILQKRCLANGSFRSVEDLRNAVSAFVAYWNREKKHPFRWSFTGFPRPARTDVERREEPWPRAI